MAHILMLQNSSGFGNVLPFFLRPDSAAPSGDDMPDGDAGVLSDRRDGYML
ncbi:hypothetical protein SEHO0A_03851 [Salmonella enterica subsp. houtenae str. ATCC BAA-1581]|nr:hypothetical protein SEHO0A_03851 [Salmonella enterica subsp. houtenae str. ATCC BAA-1581]